MSMDAGSAGTSRLPSVIISKADYSTKMSMCWPVWSRLSCLNSSSLILLWCWLFWHYHIPLFLCCHSGCARILPSSFLHTHTRSTHTPHPPFETLEEQLALNSTGCEILNMLKHYLKVNLGSWSWRRSNAADLIFHNLQEIKSADLSLELLGPLFHLIFPVQLFMYRSIFLKHSWKTIRSSTIEIKTNSSCVYLNENEMKVMNGFQGQPVSLERFAFPQRYDAALLLLQKHSVKHCWGGGKPPVLLS